MYSTSLIIAFIVLTLLMSATYFYMFARSQERFIQFWGLSWFVYLLSLFLLILSVNFDTNQIFGYRKILDMLNILFLLCGAYSYMHIHIASYWSRFVLYLTIWALIGIYYQFDLPSVCLPVLGYQIIATVNICYIIFRYWNIPLFEKGLSIAIFVLWGFGKTIMSIFEIYLYNISSLYLLEIIVSNILNFCIFVIFLYRTKASVTFAERLYKLIAENARDVIFYYELLPHPAFRYVTPSVEAVTGYSAGDFYRNPKFYQELALPEDIDAFSAIFTGTALNDEKKVFQIQTKDSSLIWIEVNDTILYEHGEAIAVECIMHDITEMKKEEAALVSSKQSRDLLFSYVSHELKTPITAILGYINGIKDGTLKSQDEKDAALDIIFSKSLMLQRLIQDLVQLSKLESKQFSFNLTHVSALELCDNLIENHTMDVQAAGISMKIEIDRALLEKAYLIVDTERIEQVFSNIIFNALKYSKCNGIIEVNGSLDRELKNLIVRIMDNGIGIPAEDLPHIFERFYRGRVYKTQNEDHGTGLGLTISREIVESFNGRIWAENAKNGGSIFTFTLPIYKESLSDL